MEAKSQTINKDKNAESNTSNLNYRDPKDVIVSYADAVSIAEMKTCTLESIFEAIRGEGWKEIIEEIRDEKGPKKRKELKSKNLAYFNLGIYKDNYRTNDSFLSTEFLLFDFDHLGGDINEKKNILTNNKNIYAMFISPSGDGLKIIMRLDNKITNKDEFSLIYKHFAKISVTAIGKEADHTSDVSHPCYISFDSDIYINVCAEPLNIEVDDFVNEEYEETEESPKQGSVNNNNNRKNNGTEELISMLNLAEVNEKCAELQKIYIKAISVHDLDRKDRIFLANLLLQFEGGKAEIHKIMKDFTNYKKAKTNAELSKLNKKPPLCRSICKKKCDPINTIGGNSPIAFAYTVKNKQLKVKKFNETELAERFLEKHPHMIYSLIDESFFEYSAGVYKELTPLEIMGLINSFLKDIVNSEAVTSHKIKGMMERLRMDYTKIFKGQFNADKFIINLQNCLYNIKEKKFFEHTPSIFSTIQLNFNFILEASAPKFVKFLKDIFGGDQEVIDFVLKIMCYFLILDYSFQKVFVFYGSGRNGKSVLANIIRELVGPANIGALPMHDIANKNFAVANLKNKLVNISSELGSDELGMSMLKRLSGGDQISADRKYKKLDNFQNKARLLVLANRFPRFSEINQAVLERFIVILFNRSYLDKNANPDLTNELIKEMPGIFNLVTSKIDDIICGDSIKFDIPEKILKNRQFMLGEISSVAEFIYSEYQITGDNSAIPLKSLFEEYKNYCKDSGYEQKGNIRFVRELESGLGLKTEKKSYGKVVYGLLSNKVNTRNNGHLRFHKNWPAYRNE